MSQLINSISIDRLVAQRNAIFSAYDEVAVANKKLDALINAANDQFPLTNPQGEVEKLFKHPNLQVCVQTGRSIDNYAIGSERAREYILKGIDAGAWKTLISTSGLRSFMSSKVKKDWDNQIFSLDVPEMTVENIRVTMGNLHENRLSMMEEGVIAVFRSLSTGFRTNQPQMFGHKIILNGLFDRYCFTNSSKVDQIDDLVRVLSLQAGKPEPDHRNGVSKLVHAAKISNGKQFCVEHEYFTLKCFQKTGTGHIKFKCPDLIIALNRILAKHFPDAIASDLRDEKPSNVQAFSVDDIKLTPVSFDLVSVLKAAEIAVEGRGYLVRLEQLNRELYQSVDEALKAIGGEFQRALKGHIFHTDPTSMIAFIVRKCGYFNPKDFGYFPTPDAALDTLMNLADVKHGMKVLEPSAGKGNISERVGLFTKRENITLVEYLPSNVVHLNRFYPNVIEGDFMKMEPTPIFDRVTMNPPFAKEQDIMHVLHAYRFLAPGGRLVAILASGWVTNQSARALAFRDFLSLLETKLIPLPANSFKESGTSVNTVILVINKPLALS